MTMTEFYRQLKTPGVSKAEALQSAQKNMLAKRQYQHPIYWAPFLLIGNWKREVRRWCRKFGYMDE